MILEHPNVGARHGRLTERAHDFAAGQILCVQDAAMAMTALAAEVVLVLASGFDAREPRSQPDQLANDLGTCADDGFDRIAVAQPGSRAQRVVDVGLERVIDAPYACDAALRVGGVGLGTCRLGQHRDGAALRGLDREHQSRDPAADNQEIRVESRAVFHLKGRNYTGFPINSTLCRPSRPVKAGARPLSGLSGDALLAHRQHHAISSDARGPLALVCPVRTIAIISKRRGAADVSEAGAEGFRVAWTTPNILTLLRMATAPVLVYLLLCTGPVAAALAAGIFFLATISDFLDGYIARSYGSGTTLGKFLDPLADKIVVLSALIMLAGAPQSQRVPAWIVVVMVAREMMVTGLRAIAAAEGLVIGAEELGKYKMVLQSIAVQGLLIRYTYFHIDFFAGAMFVLWIAMAVSVWSGIDYHVKALRALSPRPQALPHKRAAV